YRPRMVVQESEQIRFTTTDVRAVQRVAGPDLVGPGRLEPAEHLPRTRRRSMQFEAFEVALQGPLRRRPPGLCPQDPGHLRRRATQVLLLYCRRQVKNLGGRARWHPGRLRHQSGEPAGAPPPTPPVDRVAGNPDLLPERAVVLPGR